MLSSAGCYDTLAILLLSLEESRHMAAQLTLLERTELEMHEMSFTGAD